MAISTQTQNLNLIPGKSAPVVVHLSQGNVGDTVRFYLYNGAEPYVPSNVSIAVHGVRADGSVFGPYVVTTATGSNLVSFSVVSAMTSVNGAAVGELVLTDSNKNQIGSANFGMLVEKTPYSSSVTYEDDLSIYQRILAYVQSNNAATNSKINFLQTEIDQIVAPTGEAPSAAEVQNARIGADGVTYDTLGSAIRTQISELDGDVRSIVHYIVGNENIPFDFSDGYIDYTNGSWGNYSDGGKFKGTKEYIPVIPRETYRFVNGAMSGNAGYAFYDKNKTFISGSGDYSREFDAPSNAYYIRFSDYNASATHSIQFKWLKKDENYRCNQVFAQLVDGYVNCNTGSFSTYSDGGKYKRTGFLVLPKNTIAIQIPYAFNGDAGYAFYDKNREFISGGISKYDRFIINGFYSTIPVNAVYTVLSSFASNGSHSNKPIRFYNKRPDLTTIACIGDSITEGMNMSSQRYVEYGGDNYPSHLQTLLYDNGYDAFVNNYGNSGEKTAAILARLGGPGAIYLGSTITIPADNSPVDVTNNVYSSYTHELVTFTRLDYRTLASVNGQLIRLQLSSGRLYINLWSSVGENVRILGNAPITIGKYFVDRTSDIAICYMGINDTNTITFDEWIKRNNIVRQMFGEDRTIIIGTTNAQWNIYPDLKDLPDPVLTYNRGCVEAFGDYFLNLYPIMCQQDGIDIALDGGYLSDRTAEQIAADNNAIASWQVPPSLTVDGVKGNVHFNNAGYYVMAKIIYNRMIDLNLI